MRRASFANDLEYFTDQGTRSNPEFWARFGEQPVVNGKRVLDLGCGHGALSLELARQGAHVTGIDLDRYRIEWAFEHILDLPVGGSLAFECADVTTMGWRERFDLILSKDTVEHIIDLPRVMSSLRAAMKPDGELWVGCSPLYYSPWGDHGRTGLRLPWAHTLPRPFVCAAASRHQRTPVRGLADIGLNGLTPAQFRTCVAGAGLRFARLRYNCGNKRLLAVLSRIRRVRLLERYATVSIYAVLVPGDPDRIGSP